MEIYDLSMKIVRLAEGPDRALEIMIKRNDFEAKGWQIALSQKRVCHTCKLNCHVI